MAYRPSKRARHGFDMAHPNITPMMNLMVVLIPLLLTSAEFVRLGIIELNLPPAESGVAEEGSMESVETRPRLDLTVSITDQGFFISSAMAVLSGKKANTPTLERVNGTYDFAGLSQKLYEIKQKAQDKFSDMEQIIIMAEPNVDYQTIVSAMDAARSIKVDDKPVVLFPEVSLSAGIL